MLAYMHATARAALQCMKVACMHASCEQSEHCATAEASRAPTSFWTWNRRHFSEPFLFLRYHKVIFVQRLPIKDTKVFGLVNFSGGPAGGQSADVLRIKLAPPAESPAVEDWLCRSS